MNIASFQILSSIVEDQNSCNLDYNLHCLQVAQDPSEKDYELSEPPPSFPPARSIRNPNDDSGLKLTLFQYQTCPFCCKARAMLDYYGLSYDVIEVNSVTRKQVRIVAGNIFFSKLFRY